MSVPLLPIAASATLIAAGASLLLERSLVRLLAGVILLGNGVNLLIVTVSGPPGDPPILGRSAPGRMADPLPQAMVLTSIVITMGVTAFLLSMVHRSWQLTGGDEVQDDTEDRRVRLRSQHDEIAEAVRERRRAYRRLVAGQRAELARLNAARHERELREAREMRRRIDEAGAELDRWVREHGEALPPSGSPSGAPRPGAPRRSPGANATSGSAGSARTSPAGSGSSPNTSGRSASG
ncbi:Na(+)/H(+) antiporter subunit C [Streptosporangium sandarakinum]|uniref:Na(+)/H(+) antiporter subunit C n=1 Tax=Streptosporangium sandarakinum TaxID=1260955 RepID=UPI003D8B54D9